MPVWAVVPAKDFEQAKSRLSGALDGPARVALARELVDHVIGALRGASGLSGIVVVTGSRAVAEHAAMLGADTMPDPTKASTLAHVVDVGIDRARELGADAVLILMSDLPEVRSEDVEALLDELEHVDAVVVSDESGDHTNALGMRLRTRFPTHFGAADSFRRHCEAAIRAGLSLATPRLPSVAFDVDTSDDLARMRG